MKIAVVLASLLAISGCAFDLKQPDEELDSLQQADKFTGQMQIKGTLAYGQSGVAAYLSGQYPAFRFYGSKGDTATVWVKSNNGDAVAWLLDKNMNILSYNDDASVSTVDARLNATLPLTGNNAYYIVFRDYYKHPATFTVELTNNLSLPPPID